MQLTGDGDRALPAHASRDEPGGSQPDLHRRRARCWSSLRTVVDPHPRRRFTDPHRLPGPRGHPFRCRRISVVFVGVRDLGRGTPGPWDAPRRVVAVGPYRWVR